MMISDNYRNLIVKELNFVIKKMEESDVLVEKLYYFSGIHGLINRIFNIEYDPDLVFAFFVYRSTHEAFMNRYNAIDKGGDTSVQIYQKQVDDLIKRSKEFAKQIKNKEDFSDTLKKLIILLYSTTGNGYYLFQKGTLKV
jgi:hypothetical protein